MLRFLKKRFKPSKKPVPPENLTHQITDIGAEDGRDSEGEYRLRDPRAEADGTDSTIALDIDHRRGSQIAHRDGGVEEQQLPAQNAPTPILRHEGDNTSECSWL